MKDRITRHLKGSVPAADPVTAALDSLPKGLAQALFQKPLVNAAVLMPIVLHPDEMTVLLTRRTEHLHDHPGQIGFPGGRVEPDDDGPLAAALREVEEEIGLAPEAVEVAGYLDPHPVVTGFAVTPVVGFIAPTFDLRIDRFEVAEVFEVPLAFFLDEANLVTSTRTVRGVEVPVVEYRYADRRIWGATAQMIHSFIDIIS